MSKGWIVGIIVAVILLVGGSLLLANMSSNDSNKDTTSSSDMSSMDMNKDTSSSADSGDANSSEAVATDKIDITNYAFSPANATVKVGTTVTWTNKDAVGHTVTSDDGSDGGMDSKILNQGDTYTMTFSKVGTFTYHCTPHPYMKGTITVTE
jgi:amicyanin